MHRCVRVVDEQGRNMLPAENRIVQISDVESFRDVLNKVIPETHLRVSCVQLTSTASALAKDASDTQDVDANVQDLLQLVEDSQGYRPRIITYVVAGSAQQLEPPAARVNPPPTQAASDDVVITSFQAAQTPPVSHSTTKCNGIGRGSAGSSGGQKLQQTPTKSAQPQPTLKARAPDDTSNLRKQAGQGPPNALSPGHGDQPPAEHAPVGTASQPGPSAPPSGPPSALPSRASASKKRKTAHASVAPLRLNVMESYFFQASSSERARPCFKPMRDLLANAAAADVSCERWQPSTAAVVMVDTNWFTPGDMLSDHDKWAKIRMTIKSMREGMTKFTFPYGVVMIKPLPASLGHEPQEWFVWRLPNGKACAVEEAHRRMVDFFKADICSLRYQAASARAERRALLQPPSGAART